MGDMDHGGLALPKRPVRTEVETRHLRVFLAVAETANFTAASERLGITQPAVSQTIAQLERLVSTRLFERGRRKVRLTAAGARLLPHARRVLGTLDEAVNAARHQWTNLKVGFHYTAADIHTVPIAKEFEREQPGTILHLLRFDDRAAGLLDGRSHLAFVRNGLEDDRIASRIVLTEPRVAAICADDPLVSRSELDLADLRDSPLVIVPAAGSTTPGLWDPLPQRPIVETANIDEWLEAIGLSRGIGVTAASTAHYRVHPNVRFLPIGDAPPVEVRIAWLRTASHPLTGAFLDIAHRVIARRQSKDVAAV